MSHNRDADVTTHKVYGNEQINEVNQGQHPAKHEKSLGSKIVDKTKDALETSKEKIVGAAHTVKDTVTGHKHHDKHHDKPLDAHNKDQYNRGDEAIQHQGVKQSHVSDIDKQTFQGQGLQGQGLQGQGLQGQGLQGQGLQGQGLQGQGLQGQGLQGQGLHGQGLQGQGFQGQGLQGQGFQGQGLQGQGFQGQGVDSAQGRSGISSNMDSGKQDWQKPDTFNSGIQDRGMTDIGANRGVGGTEFNQGRQDEIVSGKPDYSQRGKEGWPGYDASQDRGMTGFDANKGSGSSNLGGGLNDKKL